MERVLLLGYFGAGNFGDDALLVDWLHTHKGWLSEQELMADVISDGNDVVGGFTESRELLPLIGNIIPRRMAMQLHPTGYRALITPGGSLLQDVTSVRSLVYYLWVIRRFIRSHVPVFLLHQGIGPLNSWLAAFFTPRVLNGVTLLSLRDEESYAWTKIQRSLSMHPELHLSADPMLAARLSVLPVALDGMSSNSPDDFYAVVIPKKTGDLPTPSDATTEAGALVRLLDHTASVTGLKIVLLPMHAGQDSDFCHEVAKALSTDSVVFDAMRQHEHYASAIITLVARARMVISYRLHGLVTAAAHGVPALGVAYDPKITAFSNDVGFPYSYPATLHEDAAMNDVERLWHDREMVLAELADRRGKMLDRLHAVEERFHELM